MTSEHVCTVCKGRGGCPSCRGSARTGGRRCLICRGTGGCPVCRKAFDPSAALPEPVQDRPRLLPRGELARSAVKEKSADAPVTVTRWSDARLTVRACLALLTLVAFYGFALGVAGLLLFVCWLQIQLMKQPGGGYVVLWLLIVPPIGAVLILLSILPRGPRLGYPGRGLNPKRAPELFDFVREVARETGQRMPRAIYLMHEPNAAVFSRGLFLGRGMLLGLPFFEVLTVDELRAVLAHEFGHFANQAGPITRTVYRATTTFSAAAAAAGVVPFLGVMFEVWTELYLRLAMPISRQYELRCDELACRVAGVEVTISALTKISNVGGASEIANPVDGWEEDLHSTHPPLRDRVAMARALKDLIPPERPADNRPVRVLIEPLLRKPEDKAMASAA